MSLSELASTPSRGSAEHGPARYIKHGMRVAELWLDQPVVRPAECDVLLLQQYKQAPEGAFESPFVSLTLDLQQSQEVLLQGIYSNTKYEIRRAQGKDQVVCIQEPVASEELCLQFQAFYDEFAVAKGVAHLAIVELRARARAGALRISRAVYSGQTVVWHVHAVAKGRATLLHSASHFRLLHDNETRAAVGRANRLLHWNDILGFKAEGFEVYDFGGWYAGTEDDALLKINQFKEAFGGVRVDQVNAALALNWRGWLYLKLRHLLTARQRKVLKFRLQALLRR